MKSPIRSICRLLLRVASVFPIVIAVLWAIPRNAQAQLYIANRLPDLPGRVSEYNADTGEVIKADLVAELGNLLSGPALSKATFYGLLEPPLTQASSRGHRFPEDWRCWASFLSKFIVKTDSR